MKNDEIRRAIKQARLYNYEIAMAIGISEFTLCRWLRKELTPEQQEQILTAIAAIKAGETHV